MPPDGTQATSAMVNQVGGLEEAELNLKDGTVKPLTAENPAETSSEASNVGAAVEPVAQPAEGTPPAQPTAVPPAAPILGTTPPPVEVTSGPGAVAKTAAPAAAAPAEAEPKEKPSEGPTEAERLAGLKTYGEEQAETARRAAQATADKRASVVDRQLQDANEATKVLKNDIRELQGRELTEEERATARAKYEQDDRSEGLDTQQKELLALQRDVYIDSLLLEFKEIGVTREALEQIETAEEMELFCERQTSSSLREQIKSGTEPQPAAAPEEKPAEKPAATTEKPAEQPKPQVPIPAGASAPSDVGGSGAPVDDKAFNQKQDAGAMRENLNNMGWSTVRLQ
ncbi:hypothetical protein LCGC14_0289280 [marine sediment metagenome]|uniref:Uncharacterized protein n=1 Tax=marine sediment metagenome TaxID=412755 RepID=A0A0F9WF09_9ZZZZ